jgi:hypothetical protein
MSGLGASRFTALLAAIAISGMAGAFWWAFETRSDMKAAAAHHGTSRAAPAKFNGRAHERVGKIEPKYELMGKSERPASGGIQPTPQAAVRNDEQDAAPPVLAMFPNPGAAPTAPLSRDPPSLRPSSTGLGSPGPSLPGASLPMPAAPSSRADMPLPALPAFAARPDPAPLLPAKEPEPPALFSQLPMTMPVQPAETPKRPTREAARHASAAAAPAVRAAPKPAAAPSYYTEKYLDDQGEYRYRRRVCEPPNMPDVCFMPQADRQPILAKP